MEWVTDVSIEFIKGGGDDSDGETPFLLYFNPTVPHGAASVFGSLIGPSCRSTPDLDHPLDRDPLVRGMTVDFTYEATTSNGTTVARVVPSGSCAEYRSSVVDRARNDPPDVRQQTLGALWLDDSVGALMRALEETGELNNTIILFQQDHGMQAKGSLYEGGTRIASFVHYPDGFGTEGSQFYGLTSTVDIAPTMMDFAGVADDDRYPMDGESWKDAVVVGGGATEEEEEERRRWRDERCLFFEGDYDRSVRCGRCDKFVRVDLKTGSSGTAFQAERNATGFALERLMYFDLCGGGESYVEFPEASLETVSLLFDSTEPEFIRRMKIFARSLQCHIDRTSPLDGADQDYETDCSPYPLLASDADVCADIGLLPIGGDFNRTRNCRAVDLKNNCTDDLSQHYCEETCGFCSSNGTNNFDSISSSVPGESSFLASGTIVETEDDEIDEEIDAMAWRAKEVEGKAKLLEKKAERISGGDLKAKAKFLDDEAKELEEDVNELEKQVRKHKQGKKSKEQS